MDTSLDDPGPAPPAVGESTRTSDAARVQELTRALAESREQVEHAHRRLRLLATAARRIAEAETDLAAVLDTITHEVVQSSFSESCAINLYREDRCALPLAAIDHADASVLPELRAILREHPVQPGVGVVGGAALGRATRVDMPDLHAQAAPHYRDALERHAVGSVLAVPLRVPGEILGTLTATRRAGMPPFTADDELLIQDLADRAALAVQNATLFERARRERHVAQQERERAEAANRAKDEFLAMLGHELRNPLSPILTAVQLMRLRSNDTFVRERTVIERQVGHMVRLVDDLLDVSRIARGKVELRRAPVELSAAVADAIELASPLLEQAAHKLMVDVAPGLVVEGDPLRLAQVFANLLTNAAKYMAPGGLVEVIARVHGDRVRVHVRDHGVGIEADLLPRIFDLFVQGRQASDRSEGGLGIGLAIAHGIVEMHGGTLTAVSEGPGCGSDFVVEMELLDDRRVAEIEDEAPRASPSRDARRVLVVDDNRDAADLLAETVRLLGHTVAVAYDAVGALRVAREFRPELALLDIGLPVVDGHELGRRLVDELGDAAPMLVAVTGYGQSGDHARSHAAGFVAHMVKPIDVLSLQRLVGRLDPRGVSS